MGAICGHDIANVKWEVYTERTPEFCAAVIPFVAVGRERECAVTQSTRGERTKQSEYRYEVGYAVIVRTTTGRPFKSAENEHDLLQ
jgi:hypothetical protein